MKSKDPAEIYSAGILNIINLEEKFSA